MKTISLTCPHCQRDFQKPLKEYTRRTKQGYSLFLCSRACSGKYVSVKNLPDYRAPARYERNVEHCRKISLLGAEASRVYPIEDRPFHEYWRRGKKRKKDDMDITIDYLRDVWNAQDAKCALSGIPLKHVGETTDKNTLASLDRIDCSKGYVKGNVQFVSCAVNWAKGQRSDDEVRELFNLIRKHWKEESHG